MHLLDGGQRGGSWFVGEGIGMWINQSLVVGSSHIAKTGKISGIDPCEKCINVPGGHAWRHVFMACSKLEAMAIYLVKQVCGNDKRASV